MSRINPLCVKGALMIIRCCILCLLALVPTKNKICATLLGDYAEYNVESQHGPDKLRDSDHLDATDDSECIIDGLWRGPDPFNTSRYITVELSAVPSSIVHGHESSAELRDNALLPPITRSNLKSRSLYPKKYAIHSSEVNAVINAYCQSSECNWMYGNGNLSNGQIKVIRNDGIRMKGSLSGSSDGSCSTITWGFPNQPPSPTVWKRLNSSIKKVHMVYMTHFDVGYTTMTVRDMLYEYATTYFPNAFNTTKMLRERGGKEQFAWTSHPWLISSLLRNQSGVSTPDFIRDLEDAIYKGDVMWHANAMNIQEEVGEVNHMLYGHGLARELDFKYSKRRKIAASQKDTPGVTLGMLKLFHQNGVQMLHVGVNDFSSVPAFPTSSATYHGYCNPGFLRDSTLDERFNCNGCADLLLLYCSGYSWGVNGPNERPVMQVIIPGFSEALVFLFHVDNSGPQTMEQVLDGWAATQKLYPNAVISKTSMDSWTDAFLQARRQGKVDERALTKVVDVEMGDTWVYGVPSDPTKMRWYRAVTRVGKIMALEGTLNVTTLDVNNFYTTLLKIPEHTWGYTGSWCNGQWSNKEWDDPNFQCSYGSPFYHSARQSWLDQRDYIIRAIDELDPESNGHVKERLIRAMKDRDPVVEPQHPSLLGYRKFNFSEDAIEGPLNTDASRSFARLKFNESGAVTTLIINNTTFCSAENDARYLGLFVYRTHSEMELDQFGTKYCLKECATSCGHCGFGKCGLDASGGKSTTNAIKIHDAWTKKLNETSIEFWFNGTFQNEMLRIEFGAPQYAIIKVCLDLSSLSSEGKLTMHHDLTWYGKRPTRMAESLWFAYAPQTRLGDTGWRMDKLGRWIDPFQVGINGSSAMHAVWDGIQQVDTTTTTTTATTNTMSVNKTNTNDKNKVLIVNIQTPDAPVVSPNLDLHPIGNFNTPPKPGDGWGINLFNNAWSTNYPLWSLEECERFQFSISLFAK